MMVTSSSSISETKKNPDEPVSSSLVQATVTRHRSINATQKNQEFQEPSSKNKLKPAATQRLPPRFTSKNNIEYNTRERERMLHRFAAAIDSRKAVGNSRVVSLSRNPVLRLQNQTLVGP
ncbi:hypothetical protein Hanom_Chr04g00361821 [Helianthus anomalus]